MTTWDIKDIDAMKIVNSAFTKHMEYEGKFGAYDTAAGKAGGALANSELVLKTLSEFGKEVVSQKGKAIAGHSMGAINGTATAIGHYRKGDHSMAAEAQRSATRAYVPPEMPGKSATPALPAPRQVPR